MNPRLRSFITDITAALLFGLALALAVPQVHAGIIQVQDPEKARVKQLLERPELAAELQKRGVNAADAAARVDAMTPEEVSQLAGRLDQLAAGGAMSNQELLLVIIIILLIVILI